MNIAVNLSSLQLPLRKGLFAASELGAQGVVIDARHELRPQEMGRTAVRQFKKLLGDLNLKVPAITYPTRRGYDCPDDLERRVEATKGAMKFAHDLGAPLLINQVGSIPTDSQSPMWRMMGAVISDLGIYGNKVGTTLTARTGTEPGTQLAAFLDSLPEGTLAVDFNPANLLIHGYEIDEALSALGSHIRHLTANDAVRDLGQRHGTEVQLGRGSVEFPELLGRLEEYDYQGWITITRSGAEYPLGEIRDAIAYLRSV